MCTDPKTFNGVEVSCRECDACCSTYKNTWVARCMAEKQIHEHAFGFTLTYADVDGHPPLGAKVYRYKDVQDMWKRVRSAAARKWKKKEGHDVRLRYVVVGEKGTKFGRCHYHGVVFSNYPITELGRITDLSGKECLKYRTRMHWSLWGHGFIEFQKADREGISYCLKYILKARMSSERSRGKGREGKTEWLASSYLWCSKVPSIGEPWLLRKLHDDLQVQKVPHSLRIAVPSGGDWYVRGETQRRMCIWVHDVNKAFRRQHGVDLAGYKSLLGSLDTEIENTETGEVTKPLAYEWIKNGEESESTGQQTREQQRFAARQAEGILRDIEARESVKFGHEHNKEVVRKCGNIRPCAECWQALSETNRDDIRTQWYIARGDFGEGWTEQQFNARWRHAEQSPSTGCRLRHFASTKTAFANYGKIQRSRKPKM